MAGPGPLLAIAAVGTALNAFGQYKESKAQAESLRQQSMIDGLRADEILERNEINNQLLAEDTEKVIASQSVALAAQGQDLSGTTAMGILENTIRASIHQRERNNREAEFEARMIRFGARSQQGRAGEFESAGRLKVAGTLAFGASSIYRNSPKPEKE